jgi:hypothetical protein
LRLIPPPYRGQMEVTMPTPETDRPSAAESDPTSPDLAADVEKLRDFGRRLREVDQRRASEHPTENSHWSPAIGGDKPDHR